MPGFECLPQNSGNSPIRSSSHTPVKSGIEGRCPTPNSKASEFADIGDVHWSPPVRWHPHYR
jgi:hypothetical protein